MDRKSIVTLPAKILRQRCQRVGVIDDETRQLAQDMVNSLLDWEKHRKNEIGVALAAPQVGKSVRLVIIPDQLDDPETRVFHTFINPEIVKYDGKPTAESEGCLSVADVYAEVPRYPKIKLEALNLDGQKVRITVSGFMARVLQHEVDHLHGLLFIDRVSNGKFSKLNNEGELDPLPTAEINKILNARVEPHG